MLTEADHRCFHTLAVELLQRFTEGLAICAGDNHLVEEVLVGAVGDMGEHVGVVVGMLVGLRLGEDSEADIAQRFHPRADVIGAVWGDIGEDGGFGVNIGVVFVAGIEGAEQQPAAEGIEAGTVDGGGAATEDGPEPHVEVGGIPDEEDAFRGR